MPPQRDAWLQEIEILQQALKGLTGTIHLEFTVPRIGSRLDAAVVVGPAVFVLEFKVGESAFRRKDLNQAWDYALDLKNFHSGSHRARIVPILIATEADHSDTTLQTAHPDGVVPPARSSRAGLRHLIELGLGASAGPDIDPEAWGRSPYRPTPTIIEAAQALYAGHSVEAIARHEAGVLNLWETTQCIEDVIERARTEKAKAIVFVTGVPGAGKTLVGLNIATKKRDKTQPTHAVFLSGNAPLVAVLQEALIRDELRRERLKGSGIRKGDVAQKVKPFIQNVHHFRDEGLNSPAPPSDHVVIFDEAQRAWDRKMTVAFMKTRKKRLDFAQSEPEFLLSCLDRHPDWAVVVCLVGGGQEINRGEAGISAWLEAVRDQLPDWHVFISPELTDPEYAAGQALAALGGKVHVTQQPHLHLAVSMRSFRSEKVSAFVKAVLDCDRGGATAALQSILKHYPLAVTRDLARAKRWLRLHARGSERYGVVASSGGYRLKPHAIDVRVEVNPVHWFLNDATDTRSSYFMEDAATEFRVQGLELDWVCVAWDADLRHGEGGWTYNRFAGRRWIQLRSAERRQRLLNAYRVLLTRARQGMVIVVPHGERADATRPPAFYDETFQYLAELGVPVLAD